MRNRFILAGAVAAMLPLLLSVQARTVEQPRLQIAQRDQRPDADQRKQRREQRQQKRQERQKAREQRQQKRQEQQKARKQRQQKRQQAQEQKQKQKAQERRRKDARERGKDRREDARERRQKRREDVRERRKDKREDARERGKDGRKDARDRRQDRRGDARRARRLKDLRNRRRETREGNRVVIREPGRTIIRGDGRTIIRHDPADRFRRVGGRNVRVERRGNETRTILARPGGARIITVTDRNGRLVRRVRRYPNGREVVIIDNRPRRGGPFIRIAPPVIRIPRNRYIVAAAAAPPALLYDTLVAPPVAPIERAYALDEIRYTPNLRDRMPRIDLDTVTFDTGSWELSPAEAARLEPLAQGMLKAIEKNLDEVFLIEGHTDAVGDEVDNLSLSDRRAETVAIVLTEEYQVPPENLTTQGYGEQQLKVATDGPERANRRVTVRRITPLLAGKDGPDGPGGG